MKICFLLSILHEELEIVEVQYKKPKTKYILKLLLCFT